MCGFFGIVDYSGALDIQRSKEALDTLNSREKRIVVDRKLTEKPRTLDSIGGELGVSKERVRQLETQALKKLKKHLSVHKGIHSMIGI